jgi:hypothetical protein
MPAKPAFEEVCAMETKVDGATAFGALFLATAVVMLSLMHLASEKLPISRTFLLMSVAPEAAATAGAVGENAEFPVGP